MIETKGLTKWYGGFLALDNLDLKLDKGDLFGFIGPNGAGKTTTMKILATLLSPSEGQAWVGGVDVVKDPQKVRALVGYMPDFFGVYREMRVAEYLAFFAAAYKVPGSARAKVVADLLDLVDLSSKAEETVGALSRGMQQRLGLARALVHDPQVLILDEPASGLDPRARVEVREILKELSGMGKTIILSSHILPELSHLCNRVGIIARGKLRACGTIDEVAGQVAPPRIHVRVGEAGDPEGEHEEGATGRAVLVLREAFGVEVIVEERSLIKVTPGSVALAPSDVVGVLYRGGFAMEYLEPVNPSLEEIFLHLTQDLGLGDDEGGE